MSVHIGMMIWKEMKRQNLSSVDLAAALSVGKSRIQVIIKEASIDIDLLINICAVMRFNFFQYYEDQAIFKQIETEGQQEALAEIKRLKALVAEKNKVIDLKDQLLKAQTSTITLLEKGVYR